MSRKLICLLFLAFNLSVHAQVVTVNDIVSLATMSDKKVGPYLAKLNFVKLAKNLEDGTITNEYFYSDKKKLGQDTVLRFIAGARKEKESLISFQSSSYEESMGLFKNFQLSGFINSKDTAVKTDTLLPVLDSSTLLQKEDMTVHVKEEMRDETKMYTIVLIKKPVPTASSVRYAEDLLFFDSHERLVALFGSSNVKKEMYYFTERDTTRCSVIFPNTNRQAIFIWDDQENYRTLSFLVIGGGLKPESSGAYSQAVSLNVWRSASGVYTGMRIQEIIRVNGADFNFYGPNSEFAYMAVPEKKGNIDFKLTGITLGCFNCNGSPIMKKEKISAQAAIDSGIQLFITSIVLNP
ncbi:MAG: hypothetical protein ABI480_09375 [Chitinophagaceae bacterium]